MKFGTFMTTKSSPAPASRSNHNSGESNHSNQQGMIVDPMEDPLYIHPSDNPSLVLVQPLLDEHNYHGWSRSFRRALESKNKVGFIDGTLVPPPEGDRRYVLWTKANNMIASWILNSVIPPIAQSVIWLDHAFDIWNYLKFRYGNADAFRLSNLQEELYAVRQENSSVTEYYTKLKVLWEELLVLRSIPKCVCVVGVLVM